MSELAELIALGYLEDDELEDMVLLADNMQMKKEDQKLLPNV